MTIKAFDEHKIRVLHIKINMLTRMTFKLLLRPFAMLFAPIWVLSSPHLNSTTHSRSNRPLEDTLPGLPIHGMMTIGAIQELIPHLNGGSQFSVI